MDIEDNTKNEEEDMFQVAETRLYPVLPERLHHIVKELKWDAESIHYFSSIAMFRKQIMKDNKTWNDFIKNTDKTVLGSMAYKCLTDPFTRFVFEDIEGFRSWLRTISGIKNEEQYNLLFDTRLLSSDPNVLKEVQRDIEIIKQKKNDKNDGYIT